MLEVKNIGGEFGEVAEKMDKVQDAGNVWCEGGEERLKSTCHWLSETC